MRKALKGKQGLMLDLGCGEKQPKFTRMNGNDEPETDIVHDIERFPWPLDDNSCLAIVGNHVIERIKPQLTIQFMNECWRVLKPDCQLALSTPYAGSKMFWSDPMNCNGFTEIKFLYFTPDAPQLYAKYHPKPWSIEKGFPVYQLNGNIEVVMKKIEELSYNEALAEKCISIGAIQKRSELAGFFDLIEDRKLSTVVEIGTARGGVFYGLCKYANDNATIISIDLPEGEFGGGYNLDDQRRYQKYAQRKQKLHFIRKDSHKKSTVAELKTILGNKKVDLLFIDGDHTYEGVKSDFMMYSPFMKNGGLVVFHDVCFHPAFPTCKVDQLWGELKKTYETSEIIDEKDKTWGGIGVIEWQG